MVRGPDLLWGGDIRRFHPPAGRFDGVIGGDPCPAHSHLGIVSVASGDEVADDLSAEYARVVSAAAPAWFLRENVPGAPIVCVPGYLTTRYQLDNRRDCGGVQRRVRIFDCGSPFGSQLDHLDLNWWRPPVPTELIPTVTANATVWKGGRAFGDKSERYFRSTMLPAQGLPPEFLADAPFTVAGKIRVVGNGVPLPMGRAVAKAVKHALEHRIFGGGMSLATPDDVGMKKICDQCNAPAISAACDVERTDPPGAAWKSYRKRGPVRYGCARHPPAPPCVYDQQGRLHGRLTTDDGRSIPQ